jgi:NADP-dependent 3-hydroxy acid dehydrogenase YdfG
MVASIRKEVQPFGVRVSEVLPGLIDTNFHADPAGSPAHHDWLQPTDVAWWIQAVVCAPPHVVVDEVMIHPLSQRY